MSDVWVIVEHDNGATTKVTSQLLTAARTLAKDTGGEAVAVFLGSGWSTAKERVAKFGAAKALVAESQEISDHGAAAQAEVVAKLVGDKQPWGVLFASVPTGKEVATRVAARL